MRHYGIPEKIVNLVRSLYVGTNCQMSHDGQLSEPFQINTGVRQGIRRAREAGVGHGRHGEDAWKTKDVGITWVALSKKAQERDVWRMFVCGLYPDRCERQ